MKHVKNWYNSEARKIMDSKGLLCVCFECRSTKSLEVHHQDKNITNNAFENLEVLCSKCHRNLHQIGTKHRKTSKEAISQILRKRWEEGKFSKRELPDKSGKNNPMYGKKATKKQLEGLRKGRAWNKGLKFNKRGGSREDIIV